MILYNIIANDYVYERARTVTSRSLTDCAHNSCDQQLWLL